MILNLRCGNRLLSNESGDGYVHVQATMMIFHDIQFETIQGCNRKCWHCPNRNIESTGALMTWELFERLISQLVAMGFTGGVRPYLMNECFMDERMPEMMRYIRERLPEALCVVNTNGELLSLDLAREMVGIGVKVRISAYTAETLQRFGDARIPGTHITDFTHTRETVPEVFNNRAGSIAIPGQVAIAGGCNYPFAQMYIRHNGLAVLCCNDYYNAVIVGDAGEDDLLAIFNSKHYETYREALSQGERLPPLCSQCSVLESRTRR